jgi:phosphatidylglycerophosphatase A
MPSLILFVAQGFGAGRLPFAPGTFGSLLGLFWVALLLATGRVELFLAGTLLGLALSVWLCGAAERILQQTDPGSIVLDEIAALPICFLPWLVARWAPHHSVPGPEELVSRSSLLLTLALFALFRVFDIAKPWPVRQSQRLPGGWGVTTDDALAALYVALISLLFVR